MTTKTCTRNELPHTAGRGLSDWQYAVSSPEVWDAELGRLNRTGLCPTCGAAIYKTRDRRMWHSSPEEFRLLPWLAEEM